MKDDIIKKKEEMTGTVAGHQAPETKKCEVPAGNAKEELRLPRADIERELAERTAKLEAANEELQSFVYSVSHDLRAPLRRIDAYSQRLKLRHADTLDVSGRADLDGIIAAAHRMDELIDDLLKLSSVGTQDLRRESVNLSVMAKIVLAELQTAEPSRKVRSVIAPNLVAQADGRMMRIVFENLLGNAWKFVSRQKSAEIEFGVFNGKGVRAYFVRDNGVGFNMEYAQRLFGPFQRFHSPGEFPGTGIGLATVQRIIHRHGGRVWAESRVGHGAAFYFTLPETP